MTWLEQDPGLKLGPASGGAAAITRYRLNDVTVDVDTPGAGAAAARRPVVSRTGRRRSTDDRRRSCAPTICCARCRCRPAVTASSSASSRRRCAPDSGSRSRARWWRSSLIAAGTLWARRERSRPGASRLKTLVIIPTYNESENIDAADRSAAGACRAASKSWWSTTARRTAPARLVEARTALEPRVHLLRRPGKLGLGSAYRDGFRYALEHGAEYIFEMDADFSHDPAAIGEFLRQAGRGGPGARLALPERRRHGGELAAVAAHPVLRRERVRAPDHRAAAMGRDRGLQVLPAAGARSGAARSSAIRRLRVPDRDVVQGAGSAGSASARSPSCSWIAAPDVSKMNRRIIWEAARMVWRLRFTSLLGRLE